MYEIAITVASCLRSGTRADVAWMVTADGLPVADWSDAVVFTPGGGRIGTIAGGALDGQLADRTGRWRAGRLVDLEVAEIDALIAGLATGGSAQCIVIPADTLPGEVWTLAESRDPICLVCVLKGDEVIEIRLYTDDTIDKAGPEPKRLFEAGEAGSAIYGDSVVSVFRAVPRLIVVGDNPVADALTELAPRIGWKTRRVVDAASASGVISTLSRLDKVVVTGHDLELAGTALLAALDGEAGYIGALGSHRMQESRADWLAYRGVTDLTRVHGPAGIDIGSETPGEIAVAILAEAIAERAADLAGARAAQ